MGPSPVGTSLVGTSPVGTSLMGTSLVGTSPVGPSPMGTSLVGTSLCVERSRTRALGRRGSLRGRLHPDSAEEESPAPGGRGTASDGRPQGPRATDPDTPPPPAPTPALLPLLLPPRASWLCHACPVSARSAPGPRADLACQGRSPRQDAAATPPVARPKSTPLSPGSERAAHSVQAPWPVPARCAWLSLSLSVCCRHQDTAVLPASGGVAPRGSVRRDLKEDLPPSQSRSSLPIHETSTQEGGAHETSTHEARAQELPRQRPGTSVHYLLLITQYHRMGEGRGLLRLMVLVQGRGPASGDGLVDGRVPWGCRTSHLRGCASGLAGFYSRPALKITH